MVGLKITNIGNNKMKFKEYINESKRLWYHGTSTKRWKKIQKDGYIMPALADDESFGEAVWFGDDSTEAKTYGGIVLYITNHDIMRLKHKRISSMPYGFIKKFKLDSKKDVTYDMVVLEKVPLKYIKELK